MYLVLVDPMDRSIGNVEYENIGAEEATGDDAAPADDAAAASRNCDGNCSSSLSQLAPNLAMASENPTCNEERRPREDLSDLSMHFID